MEEQERTPTTLKCDFIFPYEEEYVISPLTFDGQPTDTTSFDLTGLKPHAGYSFIYRIAAKNDQTFTFDIPVYASTLELEFTTLQPKVVSEGNVVVESISNIQNDAENVGIEWRRTDWSDDFPSNSATAYLYNGTIQGYIRNLNTNYLWKFRSFYESAAGNRYYSDWMGIDPTNTSYFEPTVHTYATHVVDGNTAQVRGYAQRGTENVTAQGFMYWVASANMKAQATYAPSTESTVPADAMKVEAKGTVMQASLEGLDYNTTYSYVAFMTTSEGETFYGEMQTFKTGDDLTPVEAVEVTPQAVSIEAIYDTAGRRQPRMQRGINILRMADGTTRKIFVK